MNFKVQDYGDPTADTLLIQMVDDHDLEVIEQELFYIRERTGREDFCLRAVKVNSWNKDLTPWTAPAALKNGGDFGDGAAETLNRILEELPADADRYEASDSGKPCIYAPSAKKIYIGGYSLSGLFALWAGYQTGRFDGIAAASPSVWYPGFTDYMRENKMQADAVYLSLGDREEKTKNPVMSQVGDAIRESYQILADAGKDCILEWNKGNHFKEPDLRTAKAFAWLMIRRK